MLCFCSFFCLDFVCSSFLLGVISCNDCVLACCCSAVGLAKPSIRPFSLNDVEILNPYDQSESAPHWVLFLFCFLTIVLYLLFYTLTAEYKFADFVLGVVATGTSIGLGISVTMILKIQVGRLRPDFITRCVVDKAKADAMDIANFQKYNTIVAEDYPCTGDSKAVTEGRKSFPSGHSSFSSVTVFLCISLALHRTADLERRLKLKRRARRMGLGSEGSRGGGGGGGNEEGGGEGEERGVKRMGAAEGSASPQGVSSSLTVGEQIDELLPFLLLRLLCLVLCGIPLYVSVFVAGSRMSDHRHHLSDVLVGYVIGAAGGLSSFTILSLNKVVRELFAQPPAH